MEFAFWVFANVVVAVLLQYMAIAFHEMGHGLMARAFGAFSFDLRIGSGRSLVDKTWGNLRLRIGCRPMGGVCSYVSPSAMDSWSHAKRGFWVSFAGPAASLVWCLGMACSSFPLALAPAYLAILGYTLWGTWTCVKPVARNRSNDGREMRDNLKLLRSPKMYRKLKPRSAPSSQEMRSAR